MPQQHPHPCAHPPCTTLVHRRFCDDHRRNKERRDRRARGKTAERGYGGKHRRWRIAVLRASKGLCVACLEECRTTAATVADHIIPISHGGARFQLSNGQALCVPCHGAKTLTEGSFGRAYIPTSPTIGDRLTIVCGPPRAGKNTYIEQHMNDGDVVVDLDEIRARKQGMGLDEAFRRRDTVLEQAKHGTSHVWLIIGAPLQSQRQAMRDGLQPGKVIVLETSPRLCMERAQDDTRDLGVAIDGWWQQYARDERDEMIRDAEGWA